MNPRLGLRDTEPHISQVAYHHLDLTRAPGSADVSVTVVDSHDVGEGGASGAMAGLLHPLTPRGKKLWKVRAAPPTPPTRALSSLQAGSRAPQEPATAAEGLAASAAADCEADADGGGRDMRMTMMT